VDFKISIRKKPSTNQLIVNKKVVPEPEIRIISYIDTNAPLQLSLLFELEFSDEFLILA
jgi:hypothetical protein